MYRKAIDWIEWLQLRPELHRFVPRDLARRAVLFVQERENRRSVGRAMAGEKANLDDFESFILRKPVSLNAPLVLISQAQRSGGSLLSQLFDGHRQIAAHPHELEIGYPTGDDWPPIDTAASPEEIFRMLSGMHMISATRRGFSKGERDKKRHRFFLPTRIHYRLFRQLCEQTPPRNARQVLDHFFMAMFNAWLNYQGGDLASKRWISAFAPRFANNERNVASFFDAYPDGRLIQILRDPLSWYPSTRNHRQTTRTGAEPGRLLDLWCESATAIVRNKERYGERVIAVRFEDLVGQTADTMRALVRPLDIDFDQLLLEPTFNGEPVGANSSFALDGSGVIAGPLKRHQLLSEQERAMVEQRCGDLYRRGLDLALDVGPVLVPMRRVE